MKKLVINYFKQTAIVSTKEEAVNFINQLRYRGSSNTLLQCNSYCEDYFQKYFSGEDIPFISEMATTNCSTTRIKLYLPLADTLEEHNLILAENKRKAEEESKLRYEKWKKEKMEELHELNEGWYIVELPCYQDDFNKGGHKERWTNWKILAKSGIDAYNKAVASAEENGYYWFTSAEKCEIQFFGVWTDEKEDYLKEEGLI